MKPRIAPLARGHGQLRPVDDHARVLVLGRIVHGADALAGRGLLLPVPAHFAADLIGPPAQAHLVDQLQAVQFQADLSGHARIAGVAVLQGLEEIGDVLLRDVQLGVHQRQSRDQEGRAVVGADEGVDQRPQADRADGLLAVLDLVDHQAGVQHLGLLAGDDLHQSG